MSATLDDTTTGGSNVVAAEWFADLAGAPGTGQPMTGVFGTSQVTVSASISAATLTTLSEGAHPILVRGRDAAGNWGPTSTTTLVVDRSGATVSGLTIDPTTSGGASTATVTATLADARTALAGAEWFVDGDPGAGRGAALTAVDGAFDEASEPVTATLPLSGLPRGEFVTSIRGRDAAGNWGAASPVVGYVTPADAVFADGFETSSTARWSSVTGTSRLSVVADAATGGRWGLRVSVAAASRTYLTDATPNALSAYHARFTFDARQMSTNNTAIDVFKGLDAGGTSILRLQYRRASAGVAQIRLGALRAGGTSWTRWANLPAGRRVVELGWTSGRSASIGLWIDGATGPTVTRLDTHAHRLESVRLGPSAGMSRSMTGQLEFDRFVSSRGSQIGL